jgi:hypothetical protein
LGVSDGSNEKPSSSDILHHVERNGFRIPAEVNTEEVSTFISSIEWHEPVRKEKYIR